MPRLVLTVKRNQLTADEKREKRTEPRLVGIVLPGAYDIDQLEIDLLHHVIGVVHLVVPFHEPPDGGRVEIEEANPCGLALACNLGRQLLEQGHGSWRE